MTTTHEPTRHIHVEGSNVSCGHEGEIDEEGYLIAQHYETNQFSHTREIKELDDHLEILQHDSRCLQLEELKSKETVRLATDEELRALLEASAFDGKDEVELGTEITVEGFMRVEQTHEETAADGETSRSVSVTVTREREDVSEMPPGTVVEVIPELKEDIGLVMTSPSLNAGLVEDLSRSNTSPLITNVETILYSGNEGGHPQLAHHTVTDPPAPIIKEDPLHDVVTEKPPTERRQSRGIIGYLKERSRSLSRNRSEERTKESVAADSDDKKKEKKLKGGWGFGKKTNGSPKKERPPGCPTGKKNVDEGTQGQNGDSNRSKLHGSVDDILKDKKTRKFSLFGKCKPSDTSDNEDDNRDKLDKGSTHTRNRSWSFLQKKTNKSEEKLNQKVERNLENSNLESAGQEDAKMKHSTNSLQRSIRGMFSGRKHVEEPQEEVCVNGPTTAATPSSLHNTGDDLWTTIKLTRRESVNSVTSPALSAGYSAVVAISIGATSSGYVYGFTQDLVSSNDSPTHGMKKPDGCDPGISDARFPSALLLTPDTGFHSTGFTARNVFQSMDPLDAADWLYFENYIEQLTSAFVSLRFQKSLNFKTNLFNLQVTILIIKWLVTQCVGITF